MPDTAYLLRRHASTVAAAMLTDVKRSAPTATVRDVRELFADDHVHCAVVVHDGRLVSVVERADLVHARDDTPAADLGRIEGRVTDPEADLRDVRRHMLRTGRRRLAVATPDGTLLGLLCLKRSRQGFCADSDVQARARAASSGRQWPARICG